MKITIPTPTGPRTYEMAQRIAVALRHITLEDHTVVFHSNHDAHLGPRGRTPWTIAWTGKDGRVRATRIHPDGSTQTTE